MGKIKKFKQFTSGILIGAMSFSGGGGVLTVFATGQETAVTTYKQEPMRLWYDEPAPKSPEYPTGTANRDGWEKWALPIGNGHMGGMVFGGVGEERIQFNEKTLWNGKCEGFGEAFDEYGNRKEAYKSLQQIQEKLRNGEDVGGLLGQLTGPYAPSGSYQSFGNIYLDFGMTAEQERSVVDYVRDLNLDTATANVEYTYNGVGYQREYFVSYPNNIMVMHLTADEANQLTFDVRATADSLEKNYEMTTEENTLVIRGQVKDNEMVFESQIKVIPTGGTVETVVEGKDSKVAIKDADEVLILMAAGTNYLNEFPTYRGVDPHDQVVKRLNLATAKGYEKLKTDHLADYQSIFKRVKLDLGESVPNKTTDELLNNYKRGANSTYLETLLFQYGRYLLIASSREGSLPANLQGIWNDMSNPPWNSDYHINVNLQMNYWPAYVTNMAECAVPLVEYIDSLREPGRITAAQYANIVSDEENPENGWMAHTQNRPFGFTTPGWSFYWGWSPSANAWIVQNVWEYHEFQDDDAYLATTIYPILRETAVFWKQFLIEDPISGRLVSSPSYSPEHGPVSVGNTFDQTLVWQLFTDTIIAANELG
ncbi:MAG: glycoside hydrolase family 95 protein, partial [Niameybacter sp.]